MLYCTACKRVTNIAIIHIEKGHNVMAISWDKLNELIHANSSTVLREVEFTPEALARVL